MDHVGSIAFKPIYHRTGDVSFFGLLKQPLFPFLLVGGSGHHIGKNSVFTHTNIFQFSLMERQLLAVGWQPSIAQPCNAILVSQIVFDT